MVIEALIASSEQLIQSFSYFGIFLISLISTSTILIPFPLYIAIAIGIGLGMNPLGIAFASGLGMSLGELTAYFLGLGGRYAIEIKHINKSVGRTVRFFTNLFQKYGFIVVVLIAAIPFPFFDVIGILAGIGRYDLKKFWIATFIGKTIKAGWIAYATFFAIPIAEYVIGF